MPKPPKFVAIAATGDTLFALDEAGSVWLHGMQGDVTGWAQLSDNRFPKVEAN